MAGHRGVVGGEAVSTQAADQRAGGAALPDLQNVLVTVQARLQPEHTEGKPVKRWTMREDLHRLCFQVI